MSSHGEMCLGVKKCVPFIDGLVSGEALSLGGVFRSDADPIGGMDGADSYFGLQRGDRFHETQ
jgi:hypothetical protein